MKLRNPYFVENMMHDQPYCSLLLVAPFCDGACHCCQNLILNDADLIDVSVNDLVSEYQNNPFIDGVTVAGLEICLSGDDFIQDFIEFVEKANVPKVTIYTRFTMAISPVLCSLLDKLTLLQSVKELYCKTGAYQEHYHNKEITLNSNNDRIWKLTLASDNQDFFVVKGDWSKSL